MKKDLIIEYSACKFYRGNCDRFTNRPDPLHVYHHRPCHLVMGKPGSLQPYRPADQPDYRTGAIQGSPACSHEPRRSRFCTDNRIACHHFSPEFSCADTVSDCQANVALYRLRPAFFNICGITLTNIDFRSFSWQKSTLFSN